MRTVDNYQMPNIFTQLTAAHLNTSLHVHWKKSESQDFFYNKKSFHFNAKIKTIKKLLGETKKPDNIFKNMCF